MKHAFLLLATGLFLLVAGLVTLTAHAGPATLRPSDPPVFAPEVKANSDTTTFGQHEPSLAVSRVHTNTVVVASKDYRENNIKHVWIESSTDGGATWPIGRQLAMPGVNTGLYPIQSDPVVMARDDGRIYVACLGTNNGQNAGAVFITWTDDDGATWRPSVQVSPSDPALDDKDWFAIDNNPASPYYHRMYMMYAPGPSFVAEQHSTDGGVTWTPRQQIGVNNTEYTYPVVGSNGTVYNFMMLNWGAGQTGTVQLTKSTNGGATWSPSAINVTTAQQPASPIRGADQFRFFAILSAAVDPNNGALYVAWTDNRNFNTDGTDVVYVKSTDTGATWSPVTRLSHDPAGVVRDHITPMITVGADSRVHAFWLDRRLDPNNHLFDSWYSSSTDGGTTWDADTRVSHVSQDLNVGFPPGSGNAAGDYWGLDTAQDTVYVAWTDTRDAGQQDIYTARGQFGGGPFASPTASLTAGPSSTATLVAPTSTPSPTGTVIATAPPTGTVSPTASVPATSTATATAPAIGTATRTPIPCTITFSDVTPNDYFYLPVQYLYCHGVVSGYADNTFRPYTDTTRAQMVKIIVLAFAVPAYSPATPTFSDVPPSHPFYAYIEAAAHANIVSGYGDGTFRPSAPVTRGQLSKIAVVAAGWSLINPAQPRFTDVLSNSAFYPYVETAACHNIISGYADNTFRPFNNAVRGQIAKIVYLAVTGSPACSSVQLPR